LGFGAATTANVTVCALPPAGVAVSRQLPRASALRPSLPLNLIVVRPLRPLTTSLPTRLAIVQRFACLCFVGRRSRERRARLPRDAAPVGVGHRLRRIVRRDRARGPVVAVEEGLELVLDLA
jgi:hypothetical protein